MEPPRPLSRHLTQFDESPYGYAWGNPIALSDPTGLDPGLTHIGTTTVNGDEINEYQFEAAVEIHATSGGGSGEHNESGFGGIVSVRGGYNGIV